MFGICHVVAAFDIADRFQQKPRSVQLQLLKGKRISAGIF